MIDLPNNLAGLSLDKLNTMAPEIALEDKLILLVVREHMRMTGTDVRHFINMLSDLSTQAFEEFTDNLASLADRTQHEASASGLSG
jgi:hypothetical protein